MYSLLQPSTCHVEHDHIMRLCVCLKLVVKISQPRCGADYFVVTYRPKHNARMIVM